MTECNQQSFEFEGHFSRQMTGRFDGGQQTSDAGGLLLRETDRRLNLLAQFAACFVDGRDPQRIEHTVREMTAQRVYATAIRCASSFVLLWASEAVQFTDLRNWSTATVGN